MKTRFTIYPDKKTLDWVKARANKNLRSAAKEIEAILLETKKEEQNGRHADLARGD